MDIQSDIIGIATDENTYLMSNGVKKESHMSWIMAAGLIVNAAMGAGLLNIAKAYDDAGGIAVSSILHA
ncbi:unnamed protein product, partial [Rotaria socialis]